MEDQELTPIDQPENPEPEPYKSTFREIPELGVQGWVHQMNKPGPQIYENLKNWIARSTLQEVLKEKAS